MPAGGTELPSFRYDEGLPQDTPFKKTVNNNLLEMFPVRGVESTSLPGKSTIWESGRSP